MPKQRPTRPAPVRLTQTATGRYPAYVSDDGRFTVTRNRPTPEILYEDSGYDIVDTAGRDVLGHPGTNRVRVYETTDFRPIIDRVRRVEHLAAVQRWEDAQARAAGRPTVTEQRQAEMTADRKSLPVARAEQ